jgi:hypothetical protein
MSRELLLGEDDYLSGSARLLQLRQCVAGGGRSYRIELIQTFKRCLFWTWYGIFRVRFGKVRGCFMYKLCVSYKTGMKVA